MSKDEVKVEGEQGKKEQEEGLGCAGKDAKTQPD